MSARLVTFHQQTRSGALIATFDGERITLDFPADPMTPTELPIELEHEWGDRVVAVGRTDFFRFVALDDADAVRTYAPNLDAIAAEGSKALLPDLPTAADADAHADAGAAGADYVLRVFGPTVGIAEDPATGSAQCSAGPYWAEALGRPSLVAHQLSPRGAVLHDATSR